MACVRFKEYHKSRRVNAKRILTSMITTLQKRETDQEREQQRLQKVCVVVVIVDFA